MGQFSWKCSDTDNVLIEHYVETDRLKPDTWTKKAYLLIPKEFGGGSFVADHNYDGYGNFFDKNGGKHDVYVELARWLGIIPIDKVVTEDEEFDIRRQAIERYYTAKDPSKSRFERGNYNACEYQVKIVEEECAYEDAEPSYDDPNQGWGDYLPEDEDDDGWESYSSDDDEGEEED